MKLMATSYQKDYAHFLNLLQFQNQAKQHRVYVYDMYIGMYLISNFASWPETI